MGALDLSSDHTSTDSHTHLRAVSYLARFDPRAHLESDSHPPIPQTLRPESTRDCAPELWCEHYSSKVEESRDDISG